MKTRFENILAPAARTWDAFRMTSSWNPDRFRMLCESCELTSRQVSHVLAVHGLTFTSAAVRYWWTSRSAPAHDYVKQVIARHIAGLSGQTYFDTYALLTNKKAPGA